MILKIHGQPDSCAIFFSCARFVVLGGTLAIGVLFFLLYVVTKMHFAEQVYTSHSIAVNGSAARLNSELAPSNCNWLTLSS